MRSLSFSLPPNDLSEPEPTVRAESLVRPLRVVIADDELVVLSFYKEVLESAGHTVVAAVENGTTLIEAALIELPDAVVTDVKMPAGDGFHAAKWICRLRQMPVVFATGFHDPAAAAACCCTVHGFLVKPISGDALLNALTRVVDRFERYRAFIKNCRSVGEAEALWPTVVQAAKLLRAMQGLGERQAFLHLEARARQQHGGNLYAAAIQALERPE